MDGTTTLGNLVEGLLKELQLVVLVFWVHFWAEDDKKGLNIP